MGTFMWPIRISSTHGKEVHDIEVIVGTGIFYTTFLRLATRQR